MADTDTEQVAIPGDTSAFPESTADVAVSKTPVNIVRFSINLAQDSADILKGVAKRKGITVTDATRRAIAIMALFDEEIDGGKTIQSVEPDGTITRIVFV